LKLLIKYVVPVYTTSHTAQNRV